MLEGLEALIALDRCGTVSEAAVSLRLTQSAVTKRIQALQNEIGLRLTVPDGRKVRLTAEAKAYVEKATPLLLELRALSAGGKTQPGLSTMSLAMADSIASSWGPEVLWKAQQALPSLKLKLHAHRSALIIESVRMGRHHMGLCTMSAKAQDLVAYPIAQEVFVLLNSKLSPKIEGKLPTITIESSSATWPAIESAVRENSYLSKTEFIRVESFQAAYQMATAGFGNALLPLGLMKTLRVKKSCYKVLPKIQREISLITRKTISQQESFQEFLLTLKKELEHSVHV